MALNKPILLSTPSFDATKPKTFLFNVESGGAQIVANQLTVRLQSTNAIVYQQKQDSFKLEHILPANTLKNGEYYSASVKVFDALGQESLDSSYIQFRCYTEPIIKFTNIPNNGIINNSSYNFQFSYTQDEGEALDNYIINLYNSSLDLVSTSGVVYVGSGAPPYFGSYLFSGFEDNTLYYIEIVGATINGAVVESGKVGINFSYVRPEMFALLRLKNNCDDGYISVQSNIVLVEADMYPNPPIYIDGNSIDLSGTNSFIDWNSGYSFSNDFLVRAWFRKPNPYTTITRFSNTSGQTITINYMLGYENVEATEMKAYVQVFVKSIDGMEYYAYSNYTSILSDENYYTLYLKRINNIYQIELLPKGGVGV